MLNIFKFPKSLFGKTSPKSVARHLQTECLDEIRDAIESCTRDNMPCLKIFSDTISCDDLEMHLASPYCEVERKVNKITLTSIDPEAFEQY